MILIWTCWQHLMRTGVKLFLISRDSLLRTGFA